MKKFVGFISILSCAAILLSVVAAAADAGAAAAPAIQSVLNVSEISEEQAELCTAVMLDGFEAEETERAAADGTLPSVSASALEGQKCMRLNGNDSVGMTLSLKKRRTTANARSLCVCAYVEPVGDPAEFVMTVTVKGTEKTVTGSSDIPAGKWCAAYLPIDTSEVINIESVTVGVSGKTSGSVRVSCLIDRVHTALVDGLPDKLQYFASAFTANRAELEYTDGSIIFKPSGANGYMESTACGYMTNGEYNALSVKIVNNSDAQSVILRLKLDKQHSYTDENSHTLGLRQGEGTYNFPIGGFRSGTTVESFRLEFPGNVSGEIEIKSISFSSYRFSASYSGTVSAEKSKNKIIVSGTMPDYPASSSRICLYRLLPGFDEEEPGGLDVQPYAEASPSSSFYFEIPQKDGNNDNSYYKYLVRYETKNGYEDAGIAYVDAEKTAKPGLKYKGVSAPADTSLLSCLMPGTVYIDVDLGVLLSAEKDVEFSFAGNKAYVSAAALERCDAVIDRCASEGVPAVVRLVYSPFADAEKYWFSGETGALPDLTSAEGTAHFMSLLSFLGERYEGRLSALMPCGDLNSGEISKLRGVKADRTAKYAHDVISAAQSALAGYGIAVIAPVCAEDAAFFLGMFEKDTKEPEKLPVFLSAGSVDEAENALGTLSGSPFGAIVFCRVNDAAELARLYYGCCGAYGVCAGGISETDDCAKLFSVIDTSYGTAAAEALASDSFPFGVSAVYSNIPEPERSYEEKGRLYVTELPETITAVYDGADTESWRGFDGCKTVYRDEINGENVISASFDFSSACFGYAALYPETYKDCDTVYFRLYADYMPEGVSEMKLRIFAEGEYGITAGYCVLRGGEIAVVSMETDPSAGRVKRFTFAPLDARSGSAPRICVFGVYTQEEDSVDTLTDAKTETMPEPEPQMFETADTTAAKDNGGGRTRLYIIAISVIIGVFAVCGAIIAVLKIRDRNREKKPS